MLRIKVSIFAVDPISGTDAEMFFWSKTEWLGYVKEFFGVYARDEVRMGFSPVIPKCSANNKLIFLPLPGMHTSMAGFNLQDQADIGRKNV